MESGSGLYFLLMFCCAYCSDVPKIDSDRYGVTTITIREENGTFLEHNSKMMPSWNIQKGRYTFQYVPHKLPALNDTSSLFNKLTKVCYIVTNTYISKRICFIAPVFANYWHYPKRFANLNYLTWMQHKQPLPVPENVYQTNKYIFSSSVTTNYTSLMTKFRNNNKHKLFVKFKNIYSSKKTLFKVMQMSSAILTGILTQKQLYTERDDINLTDYLNTQLFHHQYIINRTEQFDELFKSETTNTHQYPAQNIFQLTRNQNGILFYHVDCPKEDVNLIVVVQGKIIKNNDNLDIIEKCGYFRAAVRIALNTFNYNNRFEFIELPSEWLDDTDSDTLQIDNMQISKNEILNFRFANGRHTIYHTSKKLSEMCETLEPDVVAHKVGHNIHLNSYYSFCVSDVYSAVMEVLFKCQYDLISILHHELAHYFISSCHTNNIDFLGEIEYAFVRDLSQQARTAMEIAWRMENLQLHCP